MPWKEQRVSEQRRGFVAACLRPGERSMSELCRDFGISRKTGYKWLQRFESGGLPALEDESRRPTRFRSEIAGEVIVEIVRVRQWKPTWGGRKIRAYLMSQGLPEVPCIRSVDRILKRCGFVTSRTPGFSRIAGNLNIVQPKRCNDVWTMDFKGWWVTKNGRRCDPLTLRDEFSRYVLCLSALERSTTESVQEQLDETFRRYGLPEYIRSDNGVPFASARGFMGLTRLAVWLLKNDVTPNRILPASPYMNGAHERMHKDIKAELQRNPALDVKAEQKRFDIWRAEFNSIRPNQALNDRTPASSYRSSRRKYSDKNDDFVYPSNFTLRKVSANGEFNWKNAPVRFAKSLAGEFVALEPMSDQTLRLWFRHYPLGITDSNCRKIIPARQFQQTAFGQQTEEC
jgi:putative transposase